MNGEFRCAAAIPRIGGWRSQRSVAHRRSDLDRPNSRAEVQFDSANMLRIGGNAEVHLAQLERPPLPTGVGPQGNGNLPGSRASDANVEVDTPTVSGTRLRGREVTYYVKDTGETEITSRAGDVEIFSPGGSQWLNAGQTMQVRAPPPTAEFQNCGGPCSRRLGPVGMTPATVC